MCDGDYCDSVFTLLESANSSSRVRRRFGALFSLTALITSGQKRAPSKARNTYKGVKLKWESWATIKPQWHWLLILYSALNILIIELWNPIFCPKENGLRKDYSLSCSSYFSYGCFMKWKSFCESNQLSSHDCTKFTLDHISFSMACDMERGHLGSSLSADSSNSSE